jgi:hypothetical protein
MGIRQMSPNGATVELNEKKMKPRYAEEMRVRITLLWIVVSHYTIRSHVILNHFE